MADMTLSQLQALVEQQGAEIDKLKAAAAAATPAPTEYHVLQKSAEEIDEFFAEGGGTKNAVRYDTAQSLTTVQQNQARGNINAAPGGYGLGGNAKYLTADDDLNSVLTTGWYSWSYDKHPKNAPDNNWGQYGCMMHVFSTVPGEYAIQTVYDLSDDITHGCAIQRTIYWLSSGSIFYPWEWVTPPMRLGVEYRTTERYLGKSVYVKVVDCGALPSTASMKTIAHGIQNLLNMIVATAQAGTYVATGIYNGLTGDSLTVATDPTNIYLTTYGSWSGVNAYATLKYTKTTD